VNIVELPKSWRSRAIVVTHVTPAIDWFTEEEMREPEGFRREKRRDEWLSARMAVKKLALMRGLAQEPRQVQIARPHVIVNGVMQLYMSLSHSERFSAAAVDDEPVGIDVQALRSVDERTAKFFLSDSEARVMRRCAVTHRLLHFWCAKEAEWKRRAGDPSTLKKVPLVFESETAASVRFASVETIELEGAIAALTRTGSGL
jgi:phosphopantetheinyl transferase